MDMYSNDHSDQKNNQAEEHKMTQEQREQMLYMHYQKTLWIYWMLVLLGLGVAAIPWFLSDSTLALNISSTLTGLLVAALAIPRGVVKERYGLWDKYVRQGDGN